MRIRSAFLQRFATLILLAGAVSACSEAAPFSLSSVEPAEGRAQQAITIRIHGANFVSAVRANFDDKDKSTVSATFTAALGGVDLSGVERVSQSVLRATILAGALSPGDYELSVTDGAGRSARLPGAFTVLGDGDGTVSPDADSGPTPDGDGAPAVDTTRDGTPPDGVGPDAGGPIVPVTESSLSSTLDQARVPCVNRSGQSTGTSTPVVDRKDVRFFDWATVTRPSAPQATRTWVGAGSAVSVRFDPNACDGENVVGGDSWHSACIIVRGASLTNGQLVLAPSTTLADMNLVNCTDQGLMQGGEDFATPTDSELPTRYPQLVNPIGAVKQSIFDLAHN